MSCLPLHRLSCLRTHHAQVELHGHALNAVDVANALWALAQMRCRPPVRVLGMLMGKAYTHMGALPPEALACVIWAAAELKARPSAPWAERFLRLAYRRCAGACVCTCAHVCVRAILCVRMWVEGGGA